MTTLLARVVMYNPLESHMSRTRSLAILAGSVVGLVAARSAHAQISWNNLSGGTWHSAGNWNPANEPDNAGEDAEISIPGFYTVSLSTSRTIRDLLLYNPDAGLNITSGAILSIAGANCISDGPITINSNGGGSATALSLATGTTLTGVGDTILNATSGSLDRAYIYNPAQLPWFNDFGHVIRGRGRLYYSFTNNGTLRADVSGNTLDTLQSTVTNNGFIEAINGATFHLNGNSTNQTGGGQITSSGPGSVIAMTSASITGGTISATGGGTIVSSSGSQSWVGPISQSGPVDILNSTYIALTGTLTHTGTITVNSNSGGSATGFNLAAGATLTGPGFLTLNASSGALDRAHLFAPSQANWTNAAGHTINGKGRIYYSFINNGLVAASAPGATLELLQGTITNNATLQTENGGIMLLTSEALNQSASGVLNASNGNINLVSTTISGGTINSTGVSRVVSSSATQSFTGNPTLNATLDILNASTVAFTSSITHNGVATVNSNSGGNVTSLQVTAGTTVDGSGTIVLNATAGVLDRAQLFSPNQAAWTHGPNHSIRGRGNIYYNFINNGLVAADVINENLQLLNGTITNNATIETQNGGNLLLTSATFNQSASGIIRAANGNVVLTSATISGGTLASSGASTIVGNSGTQTLTGGVFVNGTFHVNNASSVSCPVGLNHAGSFIVNPNSGGNATIMTFGAGSIIAGSGNIILNATSGVFDRAYLHAPSGTITNANGHTISGTGNVYATWTNRGIVRPSAPSREIACQQGTFTQAPEGTLHIELGGSSAGQFGRLTGPQPKVLGGTLTVSLTNGYFPPCGSSYTIITGPISGTFSTLSLPEVPVGAMYLLYRANSVVLAYLPSDYNNDGFVDGFDYDDFVQCFEGLGCLPGKTADFNNDGFADGFDYDDFVQYFEQGC